MTHTVTLLSKSEAETRTFGKNVAKILKGGDVIGLIGELGSGKTCFVQGLAKGFDVPDDENVRSPSFTILNVYPGKVPIYHFDLYRLTLSDFFEIGYREYFESEGICVIEWAEKIKELLPEDSIIIEFSHKSFNEREITLSSSNKRVKALKTDETLRV